jgi:O-antigen ligase
MAVVAVDFWSGFALKRAYGGRHADFVHNRPVVVFALLLWPVALALAARNHGWIGIAAGIALAALVLASPSESAVLALAVGAAAFAAMTVAPGIALALALLLTLAAVAFAPFAGRLLSAAIPESLQAAMASAHVTERLGIWSAYGEAALRAPVTGWGFNASSGLGSVPALADLRARTGEALMDSHPHNAFLQVWAELGGAGGILALVTVALLFGAVRRLEGTMRPHAFALLGAVLSVGLVSHGAWQAWWWGAIGGAVVLLMLAMRDARRG